MFGKGTIGSLVTGFVVMALASVSIVNASNWYRVDGDEFTVLICKREESFGAFKKSMQSVGTEPLSSLDGMFGRYINGYGINNVTDSIYRSVFENDSSLCRLISNDSINNYNVINKE